MPHDDSSTTGLRVLVAGATGFIGAALVTALQNAGHRVVLGTRAAEPLRRRQPQSDIVAVDFASAVEHPDWRAQLRNVDAVVNAAGIVREQHGNRFDAVHDRGPRALYEACAATGPRRIIHISALGADASAATPFHRSKRDLDDWLLAQPLQAAVLLPSLVFGPGGASAGLFLGLAGLPLAPLPGGGTQLVQPMHIDDLCAAVVRLLGNGTVGRIPAVGPRCIALRDYVALLRHQLGFAPARSVAVSNEIVLRAAALVGADDTVDRDTLAMLDRGNCGAAEPLTRLLGRAPRDPSDFVSMADVRWARDAALWFWAEPAARLSLAALWIASGVFSLLYPRSESLALLARTGLHGAAAEAALHTASLLDIALGAATFVRRWRRLAYAAQLAVMAAFTLIITIALPEFWLHPFTPIAKNLPLAALTIILLWREPARGLSHR
ncbi:MAG TPA: SDR family oxidoreductase [Tahibacter sp.]|uniref:SDR family oxidoreductase n=1 Tax=Tahibacter sp. TaxID=2056211 RepID=UPI002C5D64D7|nr:SDR family oxidoreductase [Tahibacter sp.]HSX60615.1 SDR family oxidoreductase [Tahibacter sp.]